MSRIKKLYSISYLYYYVKLNELILFYFIELRIVWVKSTQKKSVNIFLSIQNVYISPWRYLRWRWRRWKPISAIVFCKIFFQENLVKHFMKLSYFICLIQKVSIKFSMYTHYGNTFKDRNWAILIEKSIGIFSFNTFFKIWYGSQIQW